MKKISLLSVALLSIIFFSSSFKKSTVGNYHHPTRSGGAAASGMAGRTGAPFNSGSTCATCHGGGSFAPTFNVELLDNTNNAVTNYIAGANYTLRISIVATNTSGGTPQYGFQTTSVKSSTDANLNTWGTSLPGGVANVLLAATSRNYVEHNTLLPTGIIDIPWTAPATNYGAVKFYTAGNAVDGSGGTSNDSPTSPNVLTIGETVLPITLLSFSVKQSNDGINITWKTAQEINNDYFLVEHSTDNINFLAVGKVNGNGNSTSEHTYNFTDKNVSAGKNYYRLAQTDFSGKINYSGVVEINYKTAKDYVQISPNPVVNKIFLKSSFGQIGNLYTVINSNGATMLSGVFIANEIDVQTLPKGTYFLRIRQKDNSFILQQFVK
jgi:hypothetical protein